MSALTDTLPVAFRITGNHNQAKAFDKILREQYFEPLKDASALQASVVPRITETGDDASAEEEPIKALEPKRLQWYPQQLAYQLNLSRKDIRRCEAYWRLHQCLISETGVGSISRQETVSMIPPLLMDVQPHHRVLDMCAAPGSKTAQLIEQLHGAGTAIPSGVVVANDADNKRCYLLTHQAKRLQSPAMMVTNHDAAFMPNFLYTRPDGGTGKLKFDRILCDVPCSGDGTLRKNCDIWTKWNPVNGANLHGLQLRIARRGLEMLAIGGRLVYSTCSMSPLENEAVLQRLLLEADGGVELVDVSQELPGLKTSSGLSHWTVMDREMNVIPSPEEIPANLTNVFSKHLFPASQDLNLHRCLRLLPHAQDTGAFFVAVLQKSRPMPGEGKRETTGPAPEGARAAPEGPRVPPPQRHKSAPKKRPRGYKEEPYFYLCDAVGSWQEARKVAIANGDNGSMTNGNEQPSVAEENGLKEEAKSEGTSSSAGNTSSDTASTDTATTDTATTDTATIDKATTDTATTDTASTDTNNSAVAKTKGPVNPEEEDVRVWAQITDFFGFNPVPEASYRNFMSRTKEHNTRNLYFTNSLVRDLVTRNQDRMKIINTGVRAFVRAENKGATCMYRVSQEGVGVVRALIPHTRVLPVQRADLVTILNDNDNQTPPELERMSLLCRDGAKQMASGSVVMEYCGDPSLPDDQQHRVPQQDKIQVSLVGWKGATSLRCYVAKDERVHFLRLLRADTSKYASNKFQAARDAAARLDEGADEEQEGAPADSEDPELGDGAPAKKIKLDEVA